MANVDRFGRESMRHLARLQHARELSHLHEVQMPPSGCNASNGGQVRARGTVSGLDQRIPGVKVLGRPPQSFPCGSIDDRTDRSSLIVVGMAAQREHQQGGGDTDP